MIRAKYVCVYICVCVLRTNDYYILKKLVIYFFSTRGVLITRRQNILSLRGDRLFFQLKT